MRTSTFIMTLRWTARITSILMLLMIMAFFVGEGFNPIRLTYDEAIRMIFFGGTILGLIIAFRWEGIGGALSVLSIAAFYISHKTMTGKFPGGWTFIAIAMPGVFFLAASILGHFKAQN